MCIIRIKDGMEFIHHWLDYIAHLVDEIVLVDNGATDKSLKVLIIGKIKSLQEKLCPILIKSEKIENLIITN